MVVVQRPRGTRDFGPEEMAVRRHAEASMRDTFRRFGYHEVQTPTFEELALFTAKSGDAIIDELYAFEDKGGRRLALRPELTAAVMRLYYESLTVEPKPLKLYYYGNCFRYDRPQKGRYREFWQMGCELIGPDTPEAVGEVLALGHALLVQTGVRDLVVRTGHIGILQGALRAVGHPDPKARGPLMRHIDKWDEDAVREGLFAVGAASDAVEWFMGLRAATTLDTLDAHLAAAPGDSTALRDAAAALRAALEAAFALGVVPKTVTIDPLIARGLDYYTGVVFEIDAPALGAEKQLLGGGTYDLSGVFEGEPVATCGFGLGFDRTLVALESEGTAVPGTVPIDVFVAPIGDGPRARALALAARLRDAGLAVEVDLMRRNPGKNLKAASTRNARHAVLIGEKELEAGTASVKDLVTGQQDAVPLDRLTEHLVAAGLDAGERIREE